MEPPKLGHPEPTWFHPIAQALVRHGWPASVEFSLVTFFIVIVLGLVAFSATRRLTKKDISRKQALWELIGQAFVSFVEGIMGPHSERFVPLIGTLFIFILVMNLFGIVPGFISPTASLSTTAALAISVFAVVQYEGMKAHGLKHYLMHFAGDPVWLAPLMFPLHLIGELAKPLSLALRLAGNVFAEDAVIGILAGLSPFLYLFLRAAWANYVPLFPMQLVILPLMIFFGMIQAFVFSMLSAIYIALMVGEGQEEMAHH